MYDLTIYFFFFYELAPKLNFKAYIRIKKKSSVIVFKYFWVIYLKKFNQV